MASTEKLLEIFFKNFREEENKKLTILNSNIEEKLTAVLETNKNLNQKVFDLEKKFDTPRNKPLNNLFNESSPEKYQINQNQSIGETKPSVDLEISLDSAFGNSDIMNKGNSSFLQSGQKFQKPAINPKKVEEPLKTDTAKEVERKLVTDKITRLEPVDQKALFSTGGLESFELPLERSNEETKKQEKPKDNILKKFVEKFATPEKSTLFIFPYLFFTR